MWLWNKAYIYEGHDKDRFIHICQALKKDNIYFESIIQDLERSKYLRLQLIFGNLGQDDPPYRYVFYIWVHKKDFERAAYWVRRTK